MFDFYLKIINLLRKIFNKEIKFIHENLILMKRVKILILGAGKVAQHYKSIFKEIPDEIYQIVGVCDTNFDAAKSLANHFNCEYSTEFNSFINKLKPDLAFVLTPSTSL